MITNDNNYFWLKFVPACIVDPIKGPVDVKYADLKEGRNFTELKASAINQTLHQYRLSLFHILKAGA